MLLAQVAMKGPLKIVMKTMRILNKKKRQKSTFSELWKLTNELQQQLTVGKNSDLCDISICTQMVRKHHQLNGYEYEQTPGDSKGQEA